MHDTSEPSRCLTLCDWRAALRSSAPGRRTYERFLSRLHPADNAWIALLDDDKLRVQLEALEVLFASVGGDADRLPLYGVPFAVKDIIDVAGWPTTAACPAYSYVAKTDAPVVARLRAAGAIVVGKTNLDQFATGLVGTRSPHGAVANSFKPEYVSGGSSSGSASVVARGLVPFSLGSDTAGSGRVPATLNNIVGLKPTRGWLSTSGVVPACRTIDCVSVFALTVEDAEQVASVAGGFDTTDPYSRSVQPDPTATFSSAPRFAIPAEPSFFGDELAAAAFRAAVQRLRALNVALVEIDFAPFAELAALLYQGPWVAERYVTMERLLNTDPDAVHPVVRQIASGAARFSAADAFKAEYRRAELAREIERILSDVDALAVPTTPSIYTIAAVQADPLTLNTRLGTYTNFTNLADLAALALPADFRSDGLPAGITLIARAGRDYALAAFGKRWQHATGLPLGATGRAATENVAADTTVIQPAPTMRIAVVGAHLTGLPLNHQLTTRGAKFVERCRTAACYRLFALPNTTPPKPALARKERGQAIEVELWDLPASEVGSFVAEIPAPLGLGTLELADGRTVKGFICEPYGLEGARDITEYRGLACVSCCLGCAALLSNAEAIRGAALI
jgi:allophanate hydrolase